MPDLFQLGEFTLHSGQASRWKIECDSLSDNEVNCLAWMLAEILPHFKSVEGVPRGGMRIAEALKPFRGIEGPHLIVDDVWTSGTSMAVARGAYLAAQPRGTRVIGAVLFARNPVEPWVTALFTRGARCR